MNRASEPEEGWPKFVPIVSRWLSSLVPFPPHPWATKERTEPS